MTGSAVSDKNRKGISLYLVFLPWSHWSASDNKAESVALNYRTSNVSLFFDSHWLHNIIVRLSLVYST